MRLRTQAGSSHKGGVGTGPTKKKNKKVLKKLLTIDTRYAIMNTVKERN